jgi:putative transposase
MDFTHDTLVSGRSFRTLNLIDRFTRECLAIEVDTSLPGARVVHLLERVIALHGVPQSIRIDTGLEFAGQVLDAWAYQN